MNRKITLYRLDFGNDEKAIIQVADDERIIVRKYQPGCNDPVALNVGCELRELPKEGFRPWFKHPELPYLATHPRIVQRVLKLG